MIFNRFSPSAFALLMSAALAFATPVWAQETTTDDTATSETATDDTATSETATDDATEPTTQSAIESQLSMGEAADAPSDLGQPYVKEENGAFELRCLRTEEPENDPCQMYQLMEDSDGVPVAEFSMFRLPDGGQAEAGATVIVPLETALTSQLTVNIDNGPAQRYPFQFCNSLGCYARIGLTQEDVAKFKRGKAASLTIVPALAPDQKVVLTMSLSGFTASYDKVSVIEQ